MIQSPVSVLAVGAAHLERKARPFGPLCPGVSNLGTVEERVGGAAFKAALAMRRFGARVRLCTVRGGDADGERVAAAVEAAGLDEHAFVWLDRASASDTALLDERGDLVAAIADMAIYDLLGKRVLRQRRMRQEMAEADALLLDSNLPAETIAHLVQRFDGRPIGAIAVSPAKAVRLGASLPKLSPVFLSRAEAAALVGLTPAAETGQLAKALGEMGARRAVVTDGPREAAILDDGLVRLQTPPAVASPRGGTAARDTLAGVAFKAFLAGDSFLEASRLGMAAASRRVSSSGATAEDTVDAVTQTAIAMAPAARFIES